MTCADGIICTPAVHYHSVLKKGDITMGKMISPKVPGFTGCCSGLCRVQAPAQPETYCSGAQCVFGLCSHYLRCPVLGECYLWLQARHVTLYVAYLFSSSARLQGVAAPGLLKSMTVTKNGDTAGPLWAVSEGIMNSGYPGGDN